MYFNNCKITSIIIPDSVTELGKWIFYNATELQEVIFSSSTKIDNIYSYSFANCTSLQILRIPTSVQHIYDYAFAYCTNLLDIILPSSLKTIGTCAFIDCTTVSTLSLPYNITTIGNNAFGNISFPNDSNISISSIFKDNENSLFNTQIYTGTEYDTYQTDLALYDYYVWVKNGMTGIANSDMGSQNHTLISQLGYFVANSTYITLFESHFLGDLNSQAKPFAEAYLKVNENGSSTADKNIQTSYFSMKNSSMILSTMTSTYEDISNNVFDYHYDLSSNTDTLIRQQVINQVDPSGNNVPFTRATLDNDITIIDVNTFENMNITNIEFNNDLTQIKSSAFKGSKLTGTLSIPSSVQSIGDYAFQDCSGITMIILPEGNLTTIGQSAFSGCGIQNIYIPKSVTSIGDSICKICPKLTVVTLSLDASGNVPTYQTVAAYKDDITSGWGIGIGGGGGNTTNSSLQYFDNGNDNINITYEFSITINPILNEITPEIVATAIGDITADDVSISVLIKHISNTTTDKIVISNNAFQNKTNLYRITMHNVSSIGELAFNGCSKLKSISIENSIQTIGSQAFANCTNLQTVKIPSRLYDNVILTILLVISLLFIYFIVFNNYA